MTAISSVHYLPRCGIVFQAAAIPARAIYALFLKAIGHLICCFGAREKGRRLIFHAIRMENRNENIFTGLLHFGKRFLVYADNHGRRMPDNLDAYQAKGYCRGNCYWLIDLHFKHPLLPLNILAREFEKGSPIEAETIHENGTIPIGEELLWRRPLKGSIPSTKDLPYGVYTFVIGFSEDENTHTAGHRIALFKGKKSYLFDPILGLMAWKEEKWAPHIKWLGKQLKTSNNPSSFLTLECFHHTPK